MMASTFGGKDSCPDFTHPSLLFTYHAVMKKMFICIESFQHSSPHHCFLVELLHEGKPIFPLF
jgi:hypothetical protein